MITAYVDSLSLSSLITNIVVSIGSLTVLPSVSVFCVSKHLRTATPKEIVSRFACFCCPFMLLMMIEIHVFWFLFPLVIVVYVSWNVYWYDTAL